MTVDVITPNSTTIDTIICEGMNYNGIEESGTYFVTTLNEETGCEDIEEINLTVLPASDPECSTSTEEIDNKIIQIFPNPASDQLIISTQENLNEVKIINTSGEVIWNINNFSQEVEIDVLEWSNGLYFLYAQFNKITIVEKINISH